MYVGMYVCMYVCMYIYIYMYTHTHRCMYTHYAYVANRSSRAGWIRSRGLSTSWTPLRQLLCALGDVASAGFGTFRV